jgi:lipoprotein NlpI
MHFCLVLTLAVCGGFGDDDPALIAGIKALDAGDHKKAVQHFTEAIAKDPKSFDAVWYRALAHDKLAQYPQALADCDKAIQLMPDRVGVLNMRGAVHFKLGKFKESLADFDKFLQAVPAEKPGHWQRGITCYYAGRYEDGYKQFVDYENVDTNDVENAVWHYLCFAKHAGPDVARKKLLKIGKDKRVPMTQVYDLFAGKCKPEDVLAACKKIEDSPEKRSRALFYAHLYLGLHFDVHGDAKRALEHLNEATEKHRIDHYMWDVARVHRDLLKK